MNVNDKFLEVTKTSLKNSNIQLREDDVLKLSDSIYKELRKSKEKKIYSPNGKVGDKVI